MTFLGNPVSTRAVPSFQEGHPRRKSPVLTDPPQETSCVHLRHSLDSPLRASTPGRLPQTGSEPKLSRGPSQHRGQAHGWCPVAGARAQRRSGHAYAHARRRVGGRRPPPRQLLSGRPPGVACEIRLQEQGGTLSRWGAGGDGPEVGGNTKRLHPRACPAQWKASECGWVWALCSCRP